MRDATPTKFNFVPDGGDCVFKLEVKEPSFLVGKQMNVDGIMYLEGCGQDIIDTILIKSVDQMQPEFR